MKHRFALLAFAAVTASVPAAAEQPVPTQALAPYVARQIAPGVHLLATPPDYLGGVTGNITLIEQSDGFVMIDSGLTIADGRRAATYVQSIGDKPVKALVFTHWHGDHPQGGGAIREAFPGVRIISTAATAKSLRGLTIRYAGLKPDVRYDAIYRQQIEAAYKTIDERIADPATEDATRERYRRMKVELAARVPDFAGTYLALPTETFTDRLLIDDAERPVELRFLGRANTDGDAIAWLPKQRVVVTGDVVVAPIPFGFFSFPGDWIGVLNRIKALDYAVLIPGHGEPQTDTAYVDKVIAAIADMRSKVAPLAKRGLSLDAVKKRLDHGAQIARFGNTERHKRQFDAFWLRPMTVNAYMEARGQPMVQGTDEIYAE